MGGFKSRMLIVAGWFLTIFTGVSVPLLILVGLFIIDYITAILACKNREQKICEAIGFKGIFKKIGMLLIVAVGIGVDILINYLSVELMVNFPFSTMISSLICVWLILNEIISIVQNLADFGVSVPFLLPIVNFIQKFVKSKIPNTEKEEIIIENISES